VLKRRSAACLLLLALSRVPQPAVAQEGESYIVIVNASNEVRELSQELVARMFLRKTRTWAGGQAVVPVDHSIVSPLRGAFSRRVLGLNLGDVRDYWMKQTLSGGELPPAIRASEREVLEFVRAERGAISYVSAGTALPADLKAVKVTQ
jgi:ABC-type phosphate transport system substrate-binding protein